MTKQDTTPPERVHRARGPGDRTAAGRDVLIRRPQARQSCQGPTVREDTQDRSFLEREKGARILTVFRVGIVFSFGSAWGATKRGLKLIQDCELVIKLAVCV